MQKTRPQPSTQQATWGGNHFYPLGREFHNFWSTASVGKAPDPYAMYLSGTAFLPKNTTTTWSPSWEGKLPGRSALSPTYRSLCGIHTHWLQQEREGLGAKEHFTWHTGLEDFIQIQGGGSGMGFLWPRWRGGRVLAPFHGLFYGGARVRSAAK
jgi:hypothetical protein